MTLSQSMPPLPPAVWNLCEIRKVGIGQREKMDAVSRGQRASHEYASYMKYFHQLVDLEMIGKHLALFIAVDF